MNRAQIEDLYVKSLQKLTRKHYISNKAALGQVNIQRKEKVLH